MNSIIRSLEKVVEELKAKAAEQANCECDCEIVKDNRVALATMAAGQRFKTDIGTFIVLGHDEMGTKVIREDFYAEDKQFDSDSPDYTKSELKEMFDTEILEAYEKEFGADNLVEHTVDLKSVDMQDFGSFDCKVRPITFDEAREYNDLLVKEDLPDYYWTCTPWSTKERGWDYSVAVVSPRGFIGRRFYDYNFGVRPFCILKSNIFVSKVEE